MILWSMATKTTARCVRLCPVSAAVLRPHGFSGRSRHQKMINSSSISILQACETGVCVHIFTHISDIGQSQPANRTFSAGHAAAAMRCKDMPAPLLLFAPKNAKGRIRTNSDPAQGYASTVTVSRALPMRALFAQP